MRAKWLIPILAAAAAADIAYVAVSGATMSDQFPVVGGPAPWHMWGTSETVIALSGGVKTSQQLARVNYGRPDTFRFIVYMSVPAGLTVGAANATFNCTLGVGRSSITIVLASLSITAPAIAGKYALATTMYTPGIEPVGTTAAPVTTDFIVAQDIQCAADVSGTGGSPVTVAAFFAPNVHIRPEWFVRKFSGELGGT